LLFLWQCADALGRHQRLNAVGGRLFAEIDGHIQVRQSFGALIFAENIAIRRVDFSGEFENACRHPHVELLDEFRGIDLFRSDGADRGLMSDEKDIFIRAGGSRGNLPISAMSTSSSEVSTGTQ
jgi:hypothetical protein